MLVIKTEGAINRIKEDMLTEPKGIRYLNDEYTEGMQASHKVQQKRFVSFMYWVKDQHRLGETTSFCNDVNYPTLGTMT